MQCNRARSRQPRGSSSRSPPLLAQRTSVQPACVQFGAENRGSGERGTTADVAAVRRRSRRTVADRRDAPEEHGMPRPARSVIPRRKPGPEPEIVGTSSRYESGATESLRSED